MNESTTSKLNWLRAAVLGANDGIVSIAALIVGVASATSAPVSVLLTGAAGLVAGALSMSVGEYVSVSSQRDVEKSLIEKEKIALQTQPKKELETLAEFYTNKGISLATAQKVAEELTAHDPIAAHLELEAPVDPDELTNPWQAAYASGISYSLGGIIPLLAMLLSPVGIRIPVTFVAVFVALIITGIASAKVSESNVMKVTFRVIVGGLIAMVVTTGVGKLFGAAGL